MIGETGSVVKEKGVPMWHARAIFLGCNGPVAYKPPLMRKHHLGRAIGETRWLSHFWICVSLVLLRMERLQL